ncbi:hypothetical protein TIFTF001_021624 [Ficus carica]|uniref:Uncharacterized protein n=1 Tax=Ficus carica TaxID=3494 RepID=A0AA88DET1_FICCA|nr:hypothetical protein TIFTF001_021624 [Ficus carica]
MSSKKGLWSGQVGSLEFGPGERVVLPPRGRVTIGNRTLRSEQITTSTTCVSIYYE